MSRRLGFWLSLAVINAIILFVALPLLHSRFPLLYSADGYADGYNQIAANLAAGNGYRFYPDTARTLMREPGYPMLLAGLFIVFHKSFAAVQMANLLFLFGGTLLLAGIARKITNNKFVIVGSALLFLFHPGTIIAESRGGIETVFTFALLLFAFTLYRALRSNDWRAYLLSGAVLGLTCLIRSVPIAFPAALLGYLLVFERHRSRMTTIFRNIIVMIVAMFVVLSPWIARNYLLTKKFIPTASVLGVAAQTGLFLATHQSPFGQRVVTSEAGLERDNLAQQLGYHFKGGFYQYFYSSIDEVTFSNYLFKRVVHTYEKSPLLFARVVGENLFYFWCWGKKWKSTALNAILQLPLLALAIVGFALSVRKGQLKAVGPLALLIMYIEAVSLPILAQARYSVPLIPFVSVFVCITLATAWAKIRGEVRTQEKGPVSDLQVSSLATNR